MQVKSAKGMEANLSYCATKHVSDLTLMHKKEASVIGIVNCSKFLSDFVYIHNRLNGVLWLRNEHIHSDNVYIKQKWYQC